MAMTKTGTEATKAVRVYSPNKKQLVEHFLLNQNDWHQMSKKAGYKKVL